MCFGNPPAQEEDSCLHAYSQDHGHVYTNGGDNSWFRLPSLFQPMWVFKILETEPCLPPTSQFCSTKGLFISSASNQAMRLSNAPVWGPGAAGLR